MKHLFIVFFLSQQLFFSQSIEDCKRRFNTYLNFKGSLNSYVKFDKEAIHLYTPGGKKDFSIYENELPDLISFLQNSTYQEQLAFWNAKSRGQAIRAERKVELKQGPLQSKTGSKALEGYRIAIDPGHFATGIKEAAYEQKYLYFKANKPGFPHDSVKLFESALSFNTAQLLKTMLEKEGAEVFLSREQNNFTSFNCTYSDWMKMHKTRVLDSLQKAGKLSPSKKAALLKAKPYDLFWDFFRDFDLQNRAEKINSYRPDVCIIIHYNVDEKNAPWKAFTEKDFTMAFIGGGFTAGNWSKSEMKINFLRLLLTPQLDYSNTLASATVNSFHKQLGIAIANPNDAKYLAENCLSSASKGVYSRNLLLCRQINSVLVYGEALYQDNAMEAAALMDWKLNTEGLLSNERLHKVAQAYYDGLMAYLRQKNG